MQGAAKILYQRCII